MVILGPTQVVCAVMLLGRLASAQAEPAPDHFEVPVPIYVDRQLMERTDRLAAPKRGSQPHSKVVVFHSAARAILSDYNADKD